MSQAKVDKYKAEKANRKKMIKKQKVKRFCSKLVATLVLVAIVAWAGVSAYHYYDSKRPAEEYEVDLSALEDYLNSVAVE